MKKSLIFIPVIAVLAIALGIFVVGGVFSENGTPPDIIQSITRKHKISTEEQQKNDIANYNRAMHYANNRACEDIKDPSQKQECMDYSIILSVSRDMKSGDCESIENEERKIECRNISFEKTANDAGNKTLCRAISDENIATRCREGIDAKKFADMQKNNTATIQACGELEGNFREECTKLVNNYQNEETYVTAIRTNNLNMCALVGVPNLVDRCRDEILLSLSEIENNIALCSNIKNTDTKNSCIQKNQAKNDAKVLDDATKSESIALCSTISSKTLAESCHDIVILSIVKKTKNSTLCDSLNSRESMAVCKNIENF